MKIMRYISALMLTVALAACNREALPDKESASLPSGKGMTFKASLAPVSSRSTFGENADESGVLYWEESDRVLICAALQTDGAETEWWDHFSEKIDEYCASLAQGHTDGSYIGRDINRYIHTTIAVPEIQADRTQALLHTDITPSSLLPDRNVYEDALYEMLAIYPVSENRTMKLIAMYHEEGDAAVGFPVEVPHIQNGKDFGRYHVCMDTGFDEEDPNGIGGLYHASDIINGNVTVNFHRFKPVTSLLRFNIRTDNPESVEIAKLVIDMKGVKGEGDQFETKLTGSSWVSTWGDSPWIIPDRWNEEAYNDVEIVFETPITVSNTPTTEKYCAVVLPSFKDGDAPHYANTYGADEVEFRAYSADGTLLFRTTKSAPVGNEKGEYPGFRAGGRYDFTLELETETPPEGALSGQFSLAEGKKAYIATGNLWAYVSNGVRDNSIANNGWKLAAHQYDIVGTAADWANFNSYSGWIDLFGFSTTANDHGITVSTDDATDYAGDAAGWTDCMAASGWRTITADEGVYLFEERANASSLFAYATIYVGTDNAAVYGLVFLPDSWITPSGCSFTPIGSIGFSFDGNKYNAENATLGTSGSWEAMESAGAVFWPVAGLRDGTAVDFTSGAYWSGSLDEYYAGSADILIFNTTKFSPEHNFRHLGGCVRLVRDVSE